MNGTFTPRPGAAPLGRQVVSHAVMETRLLLRNGEQLLLAVVIPVLVLLGAWPRSSGSTCRCRTPRSTS